MLLKEEECIFCKNKNLEATPAKLAPFIIARLGVNNDEVFRLYHCENCGSAFYDYRYEEDEVLKIYKGYRDEEYQKTRQKYESWYSKDINNLIGDDIKAINSRNKNLAEILIKNVEINNIKNVLDYGGDRGQYIPDILNNANKYVYDVSCKDVLPGIVSIKNIEDLAGVTSDGYDFVICANVLEHLSFPEKTIQIIKSIMKTKGYLYIEVPFDSPFYKQPLDNIQYLFNRYFKITDLIKKYIEIKTSKYALIHEHINFYTPNGLNALLERNGFKTEFISTKRIYSVIGMSKIISALFSLPQ